MRVQLKKRVEYIKKRFDRHLDLVLKGATKKEKNKTLPLMYEGVEMDKKELYKLSTKSKYKLCQVNEIFLQKGRMIEMQEGTHKGDTLRMKGITQSYYVYDAPLYKNSKKALDEILLE